ncbi:MAG: hypothetical protein GY830_00495 [Bacteroidetes bacterium]|nr:hypothetical protein [Bacteroidota bacterium]
MPNIIGFIECVQFLILITGITQDGSKMINTAVSIAKNSSYNKTCNTQVNNCKRVNP